jgi:hypothetical protein
MNMLGAPKYTVNTNQHQAFEAGFQMKVIYVRGKVELKSGLGE